MEKFRKSKKKIVLKIIIAVFVAWILLAVTDMIRLATADGYIEPLFTITSMACGCGESRSECSIGYSFDYSYIIDIDNSSWKYDREKPDSRSFSVFGHTIYTKE